MIKTPSGRVILEDEEEAAAYRREIEELKPYFPTTLTEEEAREVRVSCPCEMPGPHRPDCKLHNTFFLSQRKEKQPQRSKPKGATKDNKWIGTLRRRLGT